MMKRVTQMYSEMIFNHGFIHCDPHPGNVLIRSGHNGPQVILIDHGLYQTVNDEFRFNYSSLWKALIKGDLKAIRQAAKFLNVEDMFPLLSAMVSGRSWQSVKQGELSLKRPIGLPLTRPLRRKLRSLIANLRKNRYLFYIKRCD